MHTQKSVYTESQHIDSIFIVESIVASMLYVTFRFKNGDKVEKDWTDSTWATYKSLNLIPRGTPIYLNPP